jgi:hypothetical protein
MMEDPVTGHLDIKTPKEEDKKEDSSEKGKNNNKYLLFSLGIFIIVTVGIFFALNPLGDPLGRATGEIDNTDPLLIDVDKYFYTYNNYEFNYDSLLWVTKFSRSDGDYEMRLHHGPRDLQDIPKSKGLQNFLIEVLENDRIAYVQFPPDDKGVMGVAFLEVFNNLNDGLLMDVYPAFANNNTDRKDVEVISDCKDTDVPMIMLRHASPTSVIYREPGCIVVQGEEKEIWRAGNTLLYTLFGIMPS